jgi:hypothetical protein
VARGALGGLATHLAWCWSTKWGPTPLWLHIMAAHYAYSPVGERAFFEVPRNRGKNTTLIASLHARGMGPSMAVAGGTTSRVFETYVERVLAPALEPGQVVVMDKLGAHRPERIRELIEAEGCELSCTCLPTLLPSSTR